ncbi:uncharacterized protein VTP21DRAFT_3225 [Calcarisporiella thermophila]|uniref:uncharacterized protein n=1 Tax=Calcarisporiella thermophila TaxID=911321 RepID=UPI003744ADEF
MEVKAQQEEDIQMEELQDFSEKSEEQLTIDDLDKQIFSINDSIKFFTNQIRITDDSHLKLAYQRHLLDFREKLRQRILLRNALKAKLTLEHSYEPPFEFVRDAFNTDYIDPHFAVERFIKYMLWCHKEWRRFSQRVVPFISLVQSSGYGKTRMISQIAKSVHVLYICKRNPGSTGFPPASPLVDWVFKQLEVDNENDIQMFAVIMLAAAEEIEKLHMKPDEFWKMQIEQRLDCEQFWSRIKNRYESYTVDEASKAAAKNAMLDSSFLNNHHIGKGIGKIRLLCCLDEAHELFDKGKGSAQMDYSMKFRMWRRGIRYLRWEGLFSVCLSTSGKINNFFPKFELDSSAREADFTLFQPFFDVAMTDALARNMPENPTPHQLALYGRPLFGALLSKKSDLKDIVLLARTKLMGTSGDKKLTALAQLACLAALRFSPMAIFAQTLVADHMATALGVSADRTEVFLTYPSEPFLAAGALAGLDDDRQWADSVNVLVDVVHRGIAHGGECGETAVRIALLRAMQLASQSIFGNQISVERFLSTLLSDEEKSISKVRNVGRSQPPIIDGAPCTLVENTDILRQILGTFSEAEVAFNHFLNIYEKLSARDIGANLCKTCWKRRAAISLPRNSEAIDLLIPVRFKDGTFSCIAIQVKNRERDDPSNMRDCAIKMESKFLSWFNDHTPQHLHLYISLRRNSTVVWGHPTSIATSSESPIYLFISNYKSFSLGASLQDALGYLCESEGEMFPKEVYETNYYDRNGNPVGKETFHRKDILYSFLEIKQ